NNDIDCSDESLSHIVESRLRRFATHNIPIVYTAHNLLPHDTQSELDRKIYKIILQHANIIVHHGECSISLIKQHFPDCANASHIVCPHGPYTYEPKNDFQSRNLYGLPHSKYVFLNFGRQRPYKGYDFTVKVFKKWNRKDVFLFTRGPKTTFHNDFHKAFGVFKQKYIEPVRAKIASRVWRASGSIQSPVEQSEISSVIAASDVFFLGHQDGLNSGILSLAASYGKPVVFPDLGNFAEQLSGWPWTESYSPRNVDSAIKALQRMKDRIDQYPPGEIRFDNKGWLDKNSWNKHVLTILKTVNHCYRKSGSQSC
ncbi:MAG: hypothetical protein ACOC8I_03755, partial [Desulfosalsimonas sp.]